MRIIVILWIWQINAQNTTTTPQATTTASPQATITASPQATTSSLPSATDLPSATISPASQWASPMSTPSAYATTLVSMTPSPTPTKGPTAAATTYTSPLRQLNIEDWFTIILPPAIVITVLLLWIYNIRKKNAKLKWVVSNYRQPTTTLNNPVHTRVKDIYANAV